MVGETHLKKKDNLWILHNDGEYCVGLTQEAQAELGLISFVDLPPVGTKFQQGAPFIEVEAEKAVSEFVSPLSGVISSVNEKLGEGMDSLNGEDEMDAWLVSFKAVSPEEFKQL
ncbi:glycine cleavage system H protein [Enterococcus sp. PF1-24]|uniref:glycine cleavage system protein H n=1 Tax=unclassified Enterococcus TaxID=2608891 RepID=UPI002473F6F0|nr:MULTISPECIES: glycine cleavage system protein H [unclassified Enterococcus]MDH6365375.1 glycine cleavage system H protein [Enterococcus sp. PFB1-1]MDH6402476.1 glycine cleavage system H protein [Enterococcus sp. PF1-24]